MNVLVFDLETRESPPEVGWKNFAAQGISYGCAWLSGCDEFRLYGEDTIYKLVSDMADADLIVGFNIIDFDMPLLRATYDRVFPGQYAPADWEHLSAKCYDVLADIRQALGTPYAKGWKLDQVAESNLSCKKNGDGAMAPELWKAGRHAELCTYVLQDVKVERELWHHVLMHGTVKNKFVEPRVLELRGIERYRAPKLEMQPG
ncbi:MAG TPA: hypothetical protein VK465_10995 [Fibrobacteria bacterium]|nr:hypothetical protein [Fibrobacteria bacterium]